MEGVGAEGGTGQGAKMVTSEVRRGGRSVLTRRQLRVRAICWGWSHIVIFHCAGNISFPCGRLRADLGNKMVTVGTVEGIELPR